MTRVTSVRARKNSSTNAKNAFEIFAVAVSVAVLLWLPLLQLYLITRVTREVILSCFCRRGDADDIGERNVVRSLMEFFSFHFSRDSDAIKMPHGSGSRGSNNNNGENRRKRKYMKLL